MSKPYSVLEKLPAEAYLNPENFYTDWDAMHSPARHAEKMQEGYNVGKSALTVSFDHRGVWGATLRNGGCVTSYEGIGYHALTSDFLAGILASKCRVVVYRRDAEGHDTATVIVSGDNAVRE